MNRKQYQKMSDEDLVRRFICGITDTSLELVFEISRRGFTDLCADVYVVVLHEIHRALKEKEIQMEAMNE